MNARHLVPLLLVVGLAGCVTGPSDAPLPVIEADGCPGHWHFGLGIFVNGTEIILDPAEHPPYADAREGPVGVHLHDNSGLVHIHPPTSRCIATTDILDKFDVHAGDVLFVGDSHDMAGEYATWQAWVQPWGGEWTQVRAATLDGQMPDAARVLITTGGDIEAQQARVVEIPPQYEP